MSAARNEEEEEEEEGGGERRGEGEEATGDIRSMKSFELIPCSSANAGVVEFTSGGVSIIAFSRDSFPHPLCSLKLSISTSSESSCKAAASSNAVHPDASIRSSMSHKRREGMVTCCWYLVSPGDQSAHYQLGLTLTTNLTQKVSSY